MDDAIFDVPSEGDAEGEMKAGWWAVLLNDDDGDGPSFYGSLMLAVTSPGVHTYSPRSRLSDRTPLPPLCFSIRRYRHVDARDGLRLSRARVSTRP